MKKLTIVVLLVALVALSAFANATTEKAFPTKQITIVCQANPGGSSDLNCRTIAPTMSEVLGVPVNVENRPGAGGGVAISYCAEAPADGYIIAHLPVDVAQVKAAGNSDKTPSDFRVLARTTYHPAAIAVSKDSPYKTIEDLVAAARKNPGQVTISNSGTGAVWHLAAVQFEKATGVKFNHIPFEGAGPAITATMGGHVDAICASAAEVRSYVQSGDFRLLVVMDDARFGLFPEVPTAKELGYDVKVLCWLGFGVPAGTPDDAYNALLDAMKQSYDTPEYQAMLAANGYTPAWLAGTDFQKFAEEEYEIYAKLIPEVLGK